MSWVERDKGDRRNGKTDLMDAHHDAYHRLCRQLGEPDGQLRWPHAGQCEWTRANGEGR